MSEDCTGCTLCVEACPAKDRSNLSRKAINMAPQLPLRETEGENWDFFNNLPEFTPADAEAAELKMKAPKDLQLLKPYIEFSGACTGCGETPYLGIMSRLYGDHAYIANATGCSSIYGGNLPTSPWCKDDHGRGPTWSNSLFEDNAEFGLGMRLTVDQQTSFARKLVQDLAADLGDDLVTAILEADQSTAAGLNAQRERIAAVKEKLAGNNTPQALDLVSVADFLAKKSVWIIGGDGWAYDIGYGGLDHVMATGANVNILVMDTEVYSNTGGQSSKATPLGAVAKFAAGGKADREEEHGPARHGLRPRLRRPDRHGLQRHADHQGHPGSGVLRRPLAHPRLQPLHRPRHRHDQGPHPAEAGGRFRPLDPLPLRPAPARRRARTRSRSTPRRRRFRSRNTTTRRTASACS